MAHSNKQNHPNARMKEYWDLEAGRHWVAQQEHLDAQLEPYRDAILARAKIQRGDRVLDVGAGCGATTLRAADAVGANGTVVAVDLSRPMLEHTTRRMRSAGFEGRFEVLTEDAQTHGFDSGRFDVVISRFGVMFFDDPLAAFRNLARATTEQGTLGAGARCNSGSPDPL